MQFTAAFVLVIAMCLLFNAVDSTNTSDDGHARDSIAKENNTTTKANSTETNAKPDPKPSDSGVKLAGESSTNISDAHQPIKRNDGAAASNSTDRTTQTEKKAINSQETTAKPDPNGINSGVNLAVPAITMAACFLVSIALKH